ncbi:N-acetylglucosamine-6-phosphate deacetylase [Sphingobacterium siyangense]|uniref:N-acetylglucosamine-6-phosphate deacetylase n=1 Tax=Sphingobacterium siyangense TaxID=459529 RepID=UPI00196324B3|nr:N-acetylglucosamine-6-phosphate deacetylase [Sphingobacterium siyangense]QRY58740.1 N-acetylglucosamine-6-phosphate deacetylase [Sphingobacterium siyangense]
MNKIALIGGRIYTGESILEQKALLISEGKIVAIVSDQEVPADYTSYPVNGSNICAGLIDLQLYGDGSDLYSAERSVASLERIAEGLVGKGTTSFMMTLATNTIPVFKDAIRVAEGFRHDAFLGLHLEGPFLNPKKRGAHPAELIIEPTKEKIDDLLAGNQVVKMMTIAPECITDDVLKYLQSYNLLLSAGHSDATFEEGTHGYDFGIPTSTHLFNAMSPLHHREVGLVGAIFNHPTAQASIIVDGHHVSFEAVKIAKRQMGERLFMITDAVASCDKDIYQHVLNDGYYALPDGTISGAAISLLEGVKNAVQKVGIPRDEAIRMATLYPANLLNRGDIGNLNHGSMANVIVFNDDFKLEQVIFKGELKR